MNYAQRAAWENQAAAERNCVSLNASPPQPQVQQMNNRLTDALGDLHTAIEKLAECLTPAIRAENPSPHAGETKPEQPLVPLALALSDHAETAARLADRVRSLTARLEL